MMMMISMSTSNDAYIQTGTGSASKTDYLRYKIDADEIPIVCLLYWEITEAGAIAMGRCLSALARNVLERC